MEIQNTQAAQNSSALSSQRTQTTAALASDFETFLKMLTAQARFQDPLEPIDSSEYAAQLAQFSMVEQQVLTNDLLAQLDAQFGANGIGQVAGWIGMEALTSAPVAFDGKPVTVQPKIENGADEAYLVVYDDTNAEVQRQKIPTDGAPVEWLGLADDGFEIAGGTYRFTTESVAGGQTIATAPAEAYGRINEVRRQGSDSVLVLAGGATVTSDQITALRDVQSLPEDQL
jgi:flagellar basal-body rod modification protein FlgD